MTPRTLKEALWMIDVLVTEIRSLRARVLALEALHQVPAWPLPARRADTREEPVRQTWPTAS